MSLNILVTGGAGAVGTGLLKYLKSLDQDLWLASIDDYSSGTEDNHLPGVIYYKHRTQDLISAQMWKADINLIFHLAEYSRIVPSFQEIETVWSTNSMGTFQILQLARQHGAKIIYAGSSTRFAAEGVGHSPYSFSKAQSAELVRHYGTWYGVPYAICYFYNVYGPSCTTSPVPGYESVITRFYKQWKAGEALTVCGDGLQTRAFTHVDDVARGLWLAAQYPENEEFQLTNNQQYRILDIAHLFSENVIHLPTRPGDRRESTVTHQNAQQLLGWEPSSNVKDWIQHVKVAGL